MTRLIRHQPFVAVLAIGAAVLVGIIGLETGFGTRLTPQIPAGVSKSAIAYEAKVLPAAPTIDAEQAYPETAARPLFTPTRRPVPPADREAETTFKRGQYVLQGVIIAGGTRIALLRENATGKVHRVEQGRDLNGVKLADVKPESVTLAAGKEQEVLPLQVQKPGTPAAMPSSGPFGAPTPHGASSAATPATALHNPLAAPSPENAPNPPILNRPSSALPQATNAPLTPEELLARRRARRAQQTQ